MTLEYYPGVMLVRSLPVLVLVAVTLAACRATPCASLDGDALLARGGRPPVGFVSQASVSIFESLLFVLDSAESTESLPGLGGMAHLVRGNAQAGLLWRRSGDEVRVGQVPLNNRGIDSIGTETLDALKANLIDPAVYLRAAPATRVRVETRSGEEWGLFDALVEAGDEQGLRLLQWEVGQDMGSFWLLDEHDLPVFGIEEGIGNSTAWLDVWSADDPLDWQPAHEFLRCVLARFAAGDAAVK